MRASLGVLVVFRCLIAGWCFVALPLLGGGAQADPPPEFRPQVLLNGTWEMQTTRESAAAVPPAGWQPAEVPVTRHSTAAGGTRWTWYRRSVTIPDSFRDRRAFLLLNGARFNARVFWDGKQLAQRLEGWTPLEVELPQAAPGKTSELAICCQDWSATFVEGYQLPADYQGDPRYIGGGRVIAPIGGHLADYGIWDDVWLVARPAQYLDDVAVDSSFRRQSLGIRGALSRPEPGLTVAAELLDGERVVLNIPPQAVAGPRWSLEAAVPGEVAWWSPEQPRLYRLNVVLRRGAAILDVWHQRIGLRELWAQGPDLILNGVQRHLRATSGWPTTQPQSREEIRQNLQAIKAGNNVAFRLHTQPWQQAWLDAADEVGVMIVEEGALWCDGHGTYAFGDPRFWQQAGEHLAGMVRRDRNHPALVMWSLENELLHCGGDKFCGCVEEQLAALGRQVKQLDPTHLITFEADRDPGGAADVIGLHYPHELPQHADYPNTADWLRDDRPGNRDGGEGGSWRETFRWKRDKPLYIGEYLWVPAAGFAPGTVFFGDAAYDARNHFNVLAKAEAWRHQTIAYRRAGVSAFCPWTSLGSGGRVNQREQVLYDVQQEVFTPVAAFPRNLDTRFFSEETVIRTFDVFNDSVQRLDLALEWKLAGTPRSGRATLALAPAAAGKVDIQVALPAVTDTRAFDCEWTLNCAGQVRHAGRQTWHVWPRSPLVTPTDRRLLAFDPVGTWSGQADRDGLRLTRLKSLDDLATENPQTAVLIIGPGALPAVETAPANQPAEVGRDLPGNRALMQFFQRGGRALVLEQQSLAALPLGLTLVDHASTLTFPQAREHPLLAGLETEAFRYWRGDHYVSRREIHRPTSGGAVPLVVSGGAQGLDQSPLMEIAAGRGRAVVSQALLGAKMFSEPVARELFLRSLRYLAESRAASRPTLVVADDNAFGQRLTRLGIDAQPLPDAPAQLLRGDNVVLLHGGGPAVERLLPALDATLAATVYWHLPEPSLFQRWAEATLGGRATLVPTGGPVTIFRPGHPLLAGVCREDLTFAAAGHRESWRDPFIADPTVIQHAVVPIASAGQQRSFAASDMTLEGQIVHRQPQQNAVLFATAGVARFAVDLPRAGLYGLTVHAGGTSAGGVFPIVAFGCNGRRVGSVSLTQRAIAAYSALVELPAGHCELTVAYVNDAQIGGDDRNLLLAAVDVGREPLDAAAGEFLTLPSALAVLSLGHGRVVVDNVQWQRPGINAARGLRYANALLSNLGATFHGPQLEPNWVTAGHFALQGQAAHFRQTERQLSFGSNGRATATFTCVRAGAYQLSIRGSATPAAGEFGKVRVAIDDRKIAEVELTSTATAVFPVGQSHLSTGEHQLSVEFINDLWKPPEDRNAAVEAVGFVWTGE